LLRSRQLNLKRGILLLSNTVVRRFMFISRVRTHSVDSLFLTYPRCQEKRLGSAGQSSLEYHFTTTKPFFVGRSSQPSTDVKFF